MPIKTIQITTCNLCGSEQERELFTKSPAELDGWITFTVKNAKDLREKLECAVCASCAERIADLKREREAEAGHNEGDQAVYQNIPLTKAVTVIR